MAHPTSFPGSLIFPPPGAREERPWFRLVTCLQSKKNSLGTSRLLAQFLPCLLCHLQIDTIVGQVAMFYSSFQVAITQSRYSNLNLKPKQVQCSEAIYSGRDVVAISPMGYGNSLIFHLLPSLLFEKLNSQRLVPSLSFHPVVIVVSPLNALI